MSLSLVCPPDQEYGKSGDSSTSLSSMRTEKLSGILLGIGGRSVSSIINRLSGVLSKAVPLPGRLQHNHQITAVFLCIWTLLIVLF